MHQGGVDAMMMDCRARPTRNLLEELRNIRQQQENIWKIFREE